MKRITVHAEAGSANRNTAAGGNQTQQTQQRQGIGTRIKNAARNVVNRIRGGNTGTGGTTRG